jgi:hypothetical protein
MYPASLHDRWRKRLIDAKLQLDFATQYSKEVAEDCTAGTLPTPDGGYAYQRALRAEHYARGEYQRVLRIVHDLVLDGKLPDEPSTVRRFGSQSNIDYRSGR